MKKNNQSIIEYVEWCKKLGLKPSDERSLASYTNFKKAAKAVRVEVACG